MLPLPMNEYLQQALAECYFDVSSTSSNGIRCSPTGGAASRIRRQRRQRHQCDLRRDDPFFAMVRFLQSSMAPRSRTIGFHQ